MTAVDFSPCEEQMATSSLDGTVLVWNLKSLRVNKFVGHKAAVNSVKFNPTGTVIASGASDSTVKIWENDS